MEIPRKPEVKAWRKALIGSAAALTLTACGTETPLFGNSKPAEVSNVTPGEAVYSTDEGNVKKKICGVVGTEDTHADFQIRTVEKGAGLFSNDEPMTLQEADASSFSIEPNPAAPGRNCPPIIWIEN